MLPNRLFKYLVATKTTSRQCPANSHDPPALKRLLNTQPISRLSTYSHLSAYGGLLLQPIMADIQRLQAFLERVHVAPEVFKLRPDYRVLLLAVDGITPGPGDDASEALLQKAETSARAELA